MPVTLADLWGEVARNLGGVYVSAAATGGSTTTIVDSANLPAIGRDDYLNNGFAAIITDAGGAHAAPEGQVRVVSDFVQTTGTLTVNVAFTAAVAAGDTFRVWTGLPRTDLVDAVRAALVAGWPAFYSTVIDETLTLAEDTYSYAMPSGIYHPTEVYQSADDAGNTWLPLVDWRTRSNGTTRTLELEPRHRYTVGQTLRVVGIGPIAMPANDYSAITVPAEYEAVVREFVGYYGASLAHERMMGRNSGQRDYHLTESRNLMGRAREARGRRMARPPMRAIVDYPRYW
jgi:hypothetical protein